MLTMVVIQIRVPENLRERLVELQEQDRREHLSTYIRHVLEGHIEAKRPRRRKIRTMVESRGPSATYSRQTSTDHARATPGSGINRGGGLISTSRWH